MPTARRRSPASWRTGGNLVSAASSPLWINAVSWPRTCSAGPIGLAGSTVTAPAPMASESFAMADRPFVGTEQGSPACTSGSIQTADRVGVKGIEAARGRKSHGLAGLPAPVWWVQVRLRRPERPAGRSP
ncbi:hypothetical protein ACFFX0_27220 [Citricoccus parietis]|uniref:Uncharacterized protein n=1 Tax=Citricoccus parietis TaxID=592307 RepID=A0ABV5G6V5_9MICC